MAFKERLIKKSVEAEKVVMRGERNYHKSINNSYKRERATVRGSSIF